MRYLLLLLLFVLMLSPGDVTIPLCGSAIHDKYTAIGPDGIRYPTWHPQIDPSGCHFDHEHGASIQAFLPHSPFASQATGVAFPYFGYSARAMPEGHAGFKVYVFNLSGYRWMITHHFGTANAVNAACARFHTFDVAIVDSANVLQADLHLMGDFGRSRDNVTLTDLTPAACPTQGADALADGSNGRRNIPVTGNGSTGYEPWSLDSRAVLGGAFASGGSGVNTPHPQTECNTVTCTANVARTDPANNGGPALGAWRMLGLGNGFDIHATGAYSGTFYTDAHGAGLVDANALGATRQYIKPGFAFHLTNGLTCRPFDTIYWCDATPWDEKPYRANPFITGAN